MTLFLLAAYGFACAAVYHVCPAKFAGWCCCGQLWLLCVAQPAGASVHPDDDADNVARRARHRPKIGEASRARLCEREGLAFAR